MWPLFAVWALGISLNLIVGAPRESDPVTEAGQIIESKQNTLCEELQASNDKFSHLETRPLPAFCPKN